MKQTTFNLMQGALKKSAIFLGKTVLFCFYGFMAYTVFFKLYNSEMMGYVGFSLTVILSIATWKYTDLIIEEEMPWFSGFWMAFATEIELDRDEFETKYSIGRNHQARKLEEWLSENCEGLYSLKADYSYHPMKVYLKNKDDATLFKVTWG